MPAATRVHGVTSPTPQTRLILVRHGESKVMVARVVGGPRTCSGLSPLGRQQAERLRDRWLEHRWFQPDVLYASRYPRAIETAEIIQPALDNLPIQFDAGFGEHDPGEQCDGVSYDKFVTDYPDAAKWWDSQDPFASTFPGGETVAAFHYRVGQAVRRALEQHEGKTIVVACHGGVIDCVFRQFLRTPSIGVFQLHPVNTSVTEFTQLRPDKWQVERYNDSVHLIGLPSSTPVDEPDT